MGMPNLKTCRRTLPYPTIMEISCLVGVFTFPYLLARLTPGICCVLYFWGGGRPGLDFRPGVCECGFISTHLLAHGQCTLIAGLEASIQKNSGSNRRRWPFIYLQSFHSTVLDQLVAFPMGNGTSPFASLWCVQWREPKACGALNPRPVALTPPLCDSTTAAPAFWTGRRLQPCHSADSCGSVGARRKRPRGFV